MINMAHRIIASCVRNNDRVLDLGCGDGTVLEILVREKKARVQGIERNPDALRSCIEKGLDVVHSDIDDALADYPDGSFDMVILNNSFQEIEHCVSVLDESRRVGNRVIVGFPNFAHWHARYTLAVRGRAPMSKSLPYNWYDTPNLHFLSLKDFEDYCHRSNIRILRAYALGEGRKIDFLPNLRALHALYVIEGKKK